MDINILKTDNLKKRLFSKVYILFQRFINFKKVNCYYSMEVNFNKD